MCGICGYFGQPGFHEPPDLLQRMLKAIAHRGPDGNGTCIFPSAGLGHVRLAIIDLSGGIQPMAAAAGGQHLSFNGELYNYLEIRKKLSERGAIFRTESDTEVILESFRRDRVQALNDFRGMFSFAFWDEDNKEGFLVRDRFGIKPLFYTVQETRIVFASEIKAILEALPSRPTLDLNSLHLLMNFRYIPGESTMFSGIFHLPPGHCLHWNQSGYHIERWTEEIDVEKTESPQQQILHYLDRAVQRQLISDVPLGGYLSAGLDSATILALAVRAVAGGPQNYPTFTINTGDSPLEAEQALETARLFRVPNYQEPFIPDLAGNLARLIWHLEVPKVNAMQSAMVARLARKHVKVALSGLGGDEIFLGYNMHRILAALAEARKGPLLHLARTMGYFGSKSFSRLGLKFDEIRRGCDMLGALPDFAGVYGILRNAWDTPEARQRIYGPRMLEAVPENAFSTIKALWPNNDDPVIAAADFEIHHKMVNDLLLQEDRLSMAFGLEVRVPFLDEDLVALLMGLDRSIKIPRGKLKKLMRDCVSPLLPPAILNRPKSGFQVPIHLVFNSHLRPLADTYLTRHRLKQDGLFNPDFVAAVLAAQPHLRLRWHYFILYLMIGTNIWLDLFEKNSPVPQWN